MERIKLDISGVAPFLADEDLSAAEDAAMQALSRLYEGTGEGNDSLGWLSLPQGADAGELSRIEEAAARLRGQADTIIVIGIGGSYLGAKALLEALSDDMPDCGGAGPRIVFAGHTLSEDYAYELLRLVERKSVGAIVISKSGTTTEPAIAFRLVREAMERKYGREGAAERIIAVTDRRRGALRTAAEKEGYETFVIPDDVGGRYSVLTPVGLLPLAVGGADIGAIMEGARSVAAYTDPGTAFSQNPAAQYAAVRNLLYHKEYAIEMLACYEPRLQYMGEWWKQLYGESEGKQARGLFPASAVYTTDLHSLGQWVQEGPRTIFETVLSVTSARHEVRLGVSDDDTDGLNYLSGKRLGEINRTAEEGVRLAHIEGGVPNIRLEIPRIDGYCLGALVQFFEVACGASGYMLGVNPFDQPGVEAYKNSMFRLLGKPGY